MLWGLYSILYYYYSVVTSVLAINLKCTFRGDMVQADHNNIEKIYFFPFTRQSTKYLRPSAPFKSSLSVLIRFVTQENRVVCNIMLNFKLFTDLHRF